MGVATACRFCNHEFDLATLPAGPQYPWELVEDYGKGYGVFTYNNATLVYTNRGVKWNGTMFDTPALAIEAVDGYK